MAERLDLVTPDIGAPVPGVTPDGTFLDEDTGVPGTPILAGGKNSIYYFFSRMMSEVNKAFDGNPDTIASSQFFDSLKELIDGQDPAISEWAAGTFNQNDVVKYGGKQFYVGVASTINTPGPNSEWGLSPTFDEAMKAATEGEVIPGGMLQINNIRDGANYSTYYRVGKYIFRGTKYEAWRINIDGSAHTSGTSDVAKLLALYKFASNVTFSDSGGTLTLEDYQGRGAMAVDAGGKRPNVGKTSEDAFQGHLFEIASTLGSDNVLVNVSATGAIKNGGDAVIGGAATQPALTTTSPITDGVNGTPRTDDETYAKHFAHGLWAITVVVPEGTI